MLNYHYSSSQDKKNEKLIEKIEQNILSSMDDGDIPGLSLVIINKDQTIIESYGYADIEKKLPVDSKTLFELASCSKAFTALAITRLEYEQKLNLDANVSDFLPWFKVEYEGQEEEITLNQFLHHTSGIPWNTISKIPASNADDALEQTIKQLIGQELNAAPGKEYEYATINYDVLALVIEKITDMAFEEYIQTNIIDELALNSTSIGIPKDTSRMSTGYKVGFFSPRVFHPPTFKGNYAAGYVISNAEDIAKWLKFQMRQDSLSLSNLVEKTHERDETVAIHGMNFYARGWEVTLDGMGKISHAGLNPNYSSFIIFRPKEQLGVAVLSNSNSLYTTHIGNRIMKLIGGEEIEREPEPGDQSDKKYSIISIVLIIYCLIVLAFLIWTFLGIANGKRKLEKLTFKMLARQIGLLLILLPFLYGLYILPEAIANFDWDSIIVWTPLSFILLVKLVVVAIGVSYLTYLISSFFPEPDIYKRRAPQILLMSILSGLSNVVVIIMVTSAMESDKELKYLIFYYALILSVYLLGRRFVQVNLIQFTRGLIYDLRIKLIDKVFSTSYENFEKIERGRVYTSLNDDVNTIGRSTETFVTFITSVITTIGAFIFLASIASWATFITIFLIISLSALYYFVSQSTNNYFEDARSSRDVFMQLINGMIDGFKEVSLKRNKKLEYKKDVSDSALEFKNKISTADIRFVNAFLIGESLLVILLGFISFGMSRIFPNIEFYTVMSFVVVLLYLIGPINGILGSVPSLMMLKVAWNRINGFIKEIPATLDLAKVPERSITIVNNLKAIGVTFRYEQKNNEQQFCVGPIDFEINRGEVLFIIGGNGSGKTTLAKLLTGLYKPEEGNFIINNESIESSELGEYYSTVFSPAHLFKKLYNIDTENKREEVNHYLKLLNLDEKVEVIENKFSTIDLSGGQRKRLALLQCYLEDSPIYLFDEWAADQDPSYRKFFYRTLLPEMKKAGKIVIAITHDDHYFDAADRVLKMNNGKLEEFSKDLLIDA